MKSKILLFALGVTAPLFATDASKILLRGTSVNVLEGRVSGAARAVVGDLTITAEVITFDQQKNLLKCDGPVVIRTASGTVTMSSCVVELVPGEKKVGYIGGGEINFFPKMEPISTGLIPGSK